MYIVESNVLLCQVSSFPLFTALPPTFPFSSFPDCGKNDATYVPIKGQNEWMVLYIIYSMYKTTALGNGKREGELDP